MSGYRFCSKPASAVPAISTLDLGPLPSSLTFDATINADHSGLFIFDYLTILDEATQKQIELYKFAGIDAQNNRYVIGTP